jgi:hypothetical protein
VVVGSVSDTTITFGTGVAFDISESVGYLGVTSLSPTTFVVTYGNGNTYFGEVVIGTVNGTSISLGTPYAFLDTESIMDTKVTKLSETSFVVIYTTYNYEGFAVVGTISGGVVTFHEPKKFASDSTGALEYLSVTKLTNTSFAVSWRDYYNSYAGKTSIGFIDGTDILFEDDLVFTTNVSITHSTFVIPGGLGNSFIVVFRDGANTYKGTAIMGKLTA